jgi:hypothetical protein
MKKAADKSLWCLRPRGGALANLLGCLGLAALAAGCGAEPTPEEEAADQAALSTQGPAFPTAPAPAVPAALNLIKPLRIPIVRPAIPSPPSASPSPSPLPLGPRDAFAPTACPGTREQRGDDALERGRRALSSVPRAPCDPPDRLEE